jgi:FKBP-type peptidyl-prolyl cis-trans isomerase FklB
VASLADHRSPIIGDGVTVGKCACPDTAGAWLGALATIEEPPGLRVAAYLRSAKDVVGTNNTAEAQQFLAKNQKAPGVTTLPSGLQYKILAAGSADATSPKPTDQVTVQYRGRLLNGTEFDSSYKRGEPTTFPVSGVIKGWTEALQLMPVGSKWQLFVPSDLAYGERSPGPEIAPDSTLIFEVELVSIQNKSDEKSPDKK